MFFKVLQGDGLPTVICKLCIEHLELAHRLRIRCLETDSALRRIILSKTTEVDSNESVDNSQAATDSTEELESIKCLQCQATFSSEEELNLHVKTHAKKRQKKSSCKKVGSGENLTCKICNKVYLKASNLTAHMGTHTGVNPYQCNICSKRFTQGNKLVLIIFIFSVTRWSGKTILF